MNEIRRVITGLINGKSVFTRDETVKQTTVAMVAGGGFTRIYGKQCIDAAK